MGVEDYSVIYIPRCTSTVVYLEGGCNWYGILTDFLVLASAYRSAFLDAVINPKLVASDIS